MFDGGNDFVIGRLLALATHAAGFVSELRKPSQDGQFAETEATVDKLLEQVDDPGVRSLRLLGEIPYARGINIDFLGEAELGTMSGFSVVPPKGTSAVLKRSSWPEGMESLVRQRDRLEILHAKLPASGWDFRISEILAFGKEPDRVWSIEKFIAGKDGRVVTHDPVLRPAALAACANAICRLFQPTVKPTTIDSAWIEEWIDQPADLLLGPVHTLMSRGARRSAVAAFKREQRGYWLGRTVPLGWYHGDFNPGNIVFRADPQPGEPGADGATGGIQAPAVEGIIDWDRTGWNGPQGFDICHMAISARRALTGQQVGEIVCDLLLEGRWNAEELGWFADCTALAVPARDWMTEPEALRAMVTLMWLRLMAANIEKSRAYLSNRLWAAANVERVLRLWLGSSAVH
jgi:hypothetical protein